MSNDEVEGSFSIGRTVEPGEPIKSTREKILELLEDGGKTMKHIMKETKKTRGNLWQMLVNMEDEGKIKSKYVKDETVQGSQIKRVYYKK